MNTNRRIGKTLLVALLACGLFACTTQEANPPGTGGGGGSGAAGAAGATGPGGSGGAGTSIDPSTWTGSDGTACPAPLADITDFTYDPSVAGTTASIVHFGNNVGLPGGEWVSPNSGTYALASDVTQNNWHITGKVGDYSGFGLYFDSCSRFDASKYKGISFTISGSVAVGNKVTLAVGTLNDTVAWEWTNANGKTSAASTDSGRCKPPCNQCPNATMCTAQVCMTTNQYYHPGCADPTKDVPVTATPVTQTVYWTDLANGLPEASVTPSTLTSIAWSLPNPAGVGTASVTPYDVDITIDDLKFVTQ
jgi:hypothetical protein